MDKDENRDGQSVERGRQARPSSLDITSEAMRELSAQALSLVTEYFEQVAELPVFPDTSAGHTTAGLGSSLPHEGAPLEKLIADCRAIIQASRHNGHPRFFGYIASPATPVGAFADLIASALNSNVTSWRSAPAATEVEQTVVRWLSTLVGYGKGASGFLTSGGSMANLNALMIAHRTKSPADVSRAGLWNNKQPMTLYVSDQAHFSLTKAADVLGLGRDQVRVVKTDENFRMDIADLRERIEQDTREGFHPFCVVASAGTVNTGAIDQLAEIARVAGEYKLWFHVDGAYGALGALDQTKRARFDGIERADSLSLDPHKWLYAPVDCGCLLFRDEAQSRRAFAAGEADYIKIHEETDAESFAFWDYGIELSRRFRALKVWMMLSYYGARRVAESISEDNALASYWAGRVRAAEDFELLAPVELSICCFRYVPSAFSLQLRDADDATRAHLNTELDQLNARIMHRVQRGGRAYLSNATLHDRFALRACITNFRTTRDDINQTLDIVREEGMREQG